jgi:hypothetical protein
MRDNPFRGELVVVIAGLCILEAELLGRYCFHEKNYSLHHVWPRPLACFVAAAIVWWLSPRTKTASRDSRFEGTSPVTHESELPGSVLKQSAFRRTFFRSGDSSLTIDVRFWPYILCALGVLLYLIPSF